MARSRSPGYPNMPLPDALARVRKIHDADRRNPVDRAVVASHMGYSGLSGASDTAISALMHYGLLERVGKGEVRVSQLAIDILHPEAPEQRKGALYQAATSPDLFQSLKERFPDDRFSDGALRSYLVRVGFVESAVNPVVRAYTETCRYLEQEGASESGSADRPTDRESARPDDEAGRAELPPAAKGPPAPPSKPRETDLMADERVLTTGLLSKEANFRLIVNGRIGVKEIERLIKKLELDKEILADGDEPEVTNESLM